MPIPPGTQTSALFGTGKFGTFVFGVVLTQTGGLQKPQIGGVQRDNPWKRRAVATTTWTPR